MNQSVVEFDYTNSKNEFSQKKVDPIAIIYKWYSWYLVGFDRDKKDYRYYKIIRMENIKKNFRLLTIIIIKIFIKLWKMKWMIKENNCDIEILCKKNSRIKAVEYLNAKLISIKR